MKKLLITVCLSGLLSVPSAVLGAEMAGASLYGSFRTGLTFGSGDASVDDFTSRWGFTGSHEVSEGLTASYKYESKFNTTNAESSGGVGHGHDAKEAIAEMSEIFTHTFGTGSTEISVLDEDGKTVLDEDGEPVMITPVATAYIGAPSDLDQDEGNVAIKEVYIVDPNDNTKVVMVRFATITMEPGEDDSVIVAHYTVTGSQRSGYEIEGTEAIDEVTDDGGPGGRLAYVSLSGGFGTVSLGQIWSASANHYGFKVDPSYVNGSFGGASYRPGNTVSYSSSAGDVSFQIDKVTGDGERIEFGASANLGPVGVGLGYWDNTNDEGTFTGVALSAGAAGVNLTIGLGSTNDVDTETGKDKASTSILHVGGSLGDSGVSYAVQVTNTDEVYGPSHKHAGKDKSQNLIVLTNSLGSGASIIFEHLDPADLDSSSLIGLKVDF